VTGSQYLLGFCFFIRRKSLNSGGVVAFIMPSFLCHVGGLKGGRARNTGSQFPMDSYKLLPVQSQ